MSGAVFVVPSSSTASIVHRRPSAMTQRYSLRSRARNGANPVKGIADQRDLVAASKDGPLGEITGGRHGAQGKHAEPIHLPRRQNLQRGMIAGRSKHRRSVGPDATHSKLVFDRVAEILVDGDRHRHHAIMSEPRTSERCGVPQGITFLETGA